MPIVPGWIPSPVIAASLGLHAAAFAASAGFPELAAWSAVSVAANHGLLGAIGMCPASMSLGPNVTRLPQATSAGRIALTFDDGPDPVITPAILDILERYGARATFFCIGDRVAAHPAIVRDIVRRGHLIGNHTTTHPLNFACMFPSALLREIGKAQATIAGISGVAPLFFRAPMGFRSPLLDPVLHHLGLKLVSWTRRGYDTTVGNPVRLLRRLSAGLHDGEIVLLHDGRSAVTPQGKPVVPAVLPDLLDTMASRGLRSVTLADALPVVIEDAAPVGRPVAQVAA